MFLTVSGENAQEACFCLKALAPQVKSVHGIFLGREASQELEKVLRECVSASGRPEASSAEEYAIRFICLLAEKHCLKYIDSILTFIESMLNEKNGILDLDIETAAPLDSRFVEEFAQMIKEKTGAQGVNTKTHIRPELLGGYLLRVNGFYIDASIKGQADKMMTELFGGNSGKL
jgi:ATP synthase F1 delta subunit